MGLNWSCKTQSNYCSIIRSHPPHLLLRGKSYGIKHLDFHNFLQSPAVQCGPNLSDFLLKLCIFDWIWTDSGLKLLLYGTRLRINYCSPGNIGNWSLQHSPESWIYWKTDFFDSVLSWKYWKLKSSTFSISLEILEI